MTYFGTSGWRKAARQARHSTSLKVGPGSEIGQLCLFRLSSPAGHPYGSEKYGSRYQGQRGPTPSKCHLNSDRTEI